MDQPNPLTPQAPQLPDDHGPLAKSISDAHGAAAAQLSGLQKARAMTDHLRGELSKLTALGDNVTPEDVIKGAGVIVGKGGDPMALANLMADMPMGGQAINGWLQQHVATLDVNEKKLDGAITAARHQAGVAALHHIAMRHIASAFEGASASAAPQPNVEGTNALN